MVAASITALVVFILFLIYLAWQFFFSVLELIINGAVLYAIFLRAYVEIVKERKYYNYLGGACLAMAAYLIFRNFLSPIFMWGFTTYIILTFGFSQLVHFIHAKYSKKHK